MNLSADGVVFSYGWFSSPVFDDLSLAVPDGCTVLLGPNGAGKSTFMSLLASVLPPRRGRVQVGAWRSDRRRDLARLRGAVGWMPQSIVPVTGLSVREQVAYHGWLKGMSRADAWQASPEALRQADLSDLADRSAAKLSGGQLRRVGLAQTIVHRPPVLLLDEPTAGLDPAQRSAFREVLNGLAVGDTVLISTHQTSDLSDLFDSVVVLSDGRNRFTGSAESFLARAEDSGGSVERRAEAAYASVLKEAA
ncbi:ABC transporter ATP-binding protein [Nocardiopsis aegyptia]|uniref:ABC transporter ATP-binding protein n=1 Tax=Nocardiopsis aegyptia TaxID=220378 RepID=UPI00366F847B